MHEIHVKHCRTRAQYRVTYERNVFRLSVIEKGGRRNVINKSSEIVQFKKS